MNFNLGFEPLNLRTDDRSRTFESFGSGIALNTGSGTVWKRAYEYQLSEEGIFVSIASVVVNVVRSLVGFVVLEVLLHRSGIFGNADADAADAAAAKKNPKLV